jgi:hypothetical protein
MNSKRMTIIDAGLPFFDLDVYDDQTMSKDIKNSDNHKIVYVTVM